MCKQWFVVLVLLGLSACASTPSSTKSSYIYPSVILPSADALDLQGEVRRAVFSRTLNGVRSDLQVDFDALGRLYKVEGNADAIRGLSALEFRGLVSNQFEVNYVKDSQAWSKVELIERGIFSTIGALTPYEFYPDARLKLLKVYAEKGQSGISNVVSSYVMRYAYQDGMVVGKMYDDGLHRASLVYQFQGDQLVNEFKFPGKHAVPSDVSDREAFMSTPESSRRYVYRDGKLVETHIDNKRRKRRNIYRYSEAGLLIEKQAYEDEALKETVSYYDYQFDECGNWLSRKEKVERAAGFIQQNTDTLRERQISYAEGFCSTKVEQKPAG